MKPSNLSSPWKLFKKRWETPETNHKGGMDYGLNNKAFKRVVR